MNFSELPPLPFDVPKEVMEKAANIELALFDVDGVLTDGSLQYGEHGEQLKTFNALDGHGLKMLQMAGVKVGVISARKSPALERRLNDLGIEKQYLGVENKLSIFHKLIDEMGIARQQSAFTGDDVIDLPVMMECGLRLTVANGHFLVKHYADWAAPFTGGSGAVRAICDMLLYSKMRYPLNIHPAQ